MTQKVEVKAPGFFALLTLIFITLKLTDHIDWSWFWVLSPMLLPFLFVVGVLALGVVVFGLGAVVITILERWR